MSWGAAGFFIFAQRGWRLFEIKQRINTSNVTYQTAAWQSLRPKSKEEKFMDFFASAVDVLQTLVIALGAGLGIWGVINLLEGYGNDNPGAKSQGMKQLMAGGGVALIGMVLVPLLSGLF